MITYTPSGGSGATITYSYDALGRLTCAGTSVGSYTVYTLDPADNRKQVTTNTTPCNATGQAPTTMNSMATVVENSSGNNIPLSISGGTPTYVTVTTSATNGMAVANGISVFYTPSPNYAGNDSFQYTASNSYGTSTPATVAITVSVQVQPPVANPVSKTVAYNSTNNNVPLSISGGAATSVAVSTAAGHGTATASGTTISYTPTTGYSGPDSFYYTASNAGGTSAPAKATITVNQQAPIANPVRDTVGESSGNNSVPLNITGGTPTSVAVSTAPSHGQASPSGILIYYTPTIGYVGSDSFQYTATNAAGTSAPATVSMTVSTTTPPPIANPVNASIGYNASQTDLPLNITGGAASSVAVTTPPSRGNAVVMGPTIWYTPNTGYSGPDSLYYDASNSAGTSSPALVTITVATPNTHISPNPFWNDINASNPSNPATGTSTAQPIQGIQVPVTLQLGIGGVTTSRISKYAINGGTWTAFSNGNTITVSPNDTLAFSVTRITPGTASGTITVNNQSDGGVQIATFNFSVTAGNN